MIETNNISDNTNSDYYSYKIKLKGKKGLLFATSENKIVTFHFKTKQKITYEDLYKICFKLQYTCYRINNQFAFDDFLMSEYIKRYDITDVSVDISFWVPLKTYSDLEKDNEAFLSVAPKDKETIVELVHGQNGVSSETDYYLESSFTLRVKDRNVSKCINLITKEDEEDQWGFVNIHQYNRELGFMPYSNDKRAFDSIHGDNIPYFHAVYFEPIRYWMCNIKDIDAEKAYLQFDA